MLASVLGEYLRASYGEVGGSGARVGLAALLSEHTAEAGALIG